MADNTTVDNGALTDYVVADDDDGTAKHQYVKVEFGGDNTQTKVTTTTGLPIQGTAGGTAVPVSGTVTATVTGATITANVVGTGATTIAAARASVTTTSASAVATRATRTKITLLALSSNTDTIDVGPSGVASGSGFPLAPGASVTLETTAAIHADAASGTQVLASIEEYS